MNEELKARLARKRVALGGREKKAPPKRRSKMMATAVTAVTAANKMKKVTPPTTAAVCVGWVVRVCPCARAIDHRWRRCAGHQAPAFAEG